MPTSWAEDHVPLESLNGIGPHFPRSITDSPYLNAEWEQPPELVLLSGDGHYWIALDYRGTTSDPPVVWFDNEVDQDIRLAPSFLDFVERLRPADSFEQSD